MRPDRMKVIEGGVTVDVFGIARRRRDSAVQGLAELRDHEGLLSAVVGKIEKR
jgi:hypothetical protein